MAEAGQPEGVHRGLWVGLLPQAVVTHLAGVKHLGMSPRRVAALREVRMWRSSRFMEATRDSFPVSLSCAYVTPLVVARGFVTCSTT